MGFNLGAFGGGLGQGINNGIALGRQVQATIDAQNIRDLQQKGMEEANAARDQSITDSIKTNGLQGPASDQSATSDATAAATNASPALGGLSAGTDVSQAPAAQLVPTSDVSASGSAPQFSTTAPTYSTGGKTFDDYDAARTAASANAPSATDLFIKNSVPKVQAMYLAQGDPEKAQAWQDWADKTQNQSTMKTWAKAYQAAQAGDYDSAINHMVDLYDKVDDGISVVDKTPQLDQNGKLTGYQVTLQNKDGKQWQQSFDPQSLLQQGMAGLAPDKMFEMTYKTATDAAAARAKYAEQTAHDASQYKQALVLAGIKGGQEAAHDNRTADAASSLEDKKHGNQMEEDAAKGNIATVQEAAKDQAKLNAKVGALKAAGYSDDDIKGFMPMLLNADSYKKPTSPAETRRMAFDARMKSDFTFARKSPEEQSRIVDGDMAIINGGASPGAAARTAPNPFQNTAAAGLPPRGGAAPAGKGIPVYDTKTGQIVYQ